MGVNRLDSLNKPFVFREKDSIGLSKFLDAELGNHKFTIKCSDGLDKEIGDINNLLQFENLNSCQIEELTIAFRSEKGRFTLKLDKSSFSNVTINLFADEQIGKKLYEPFEKRHFDVHVFYTMSN